MIRVEVDRATWVRGVASLLLDAGGCRCALGFVGKVCGVDDAAMFRRIGPAGTLAFPGHRDMPWPAALLQDERTTRLARAIAGANDASNLANREEVLAKLCEEAGLELVFVGSGNPLWRAS